MPKYPIIDQRPLARAQRGGPWGMGRRSRSASDLPLPSAHETVVYKSGGSYVVDDGRSRPSDDHIVNATDVSVVDMRENAPVTVHTSIPSAGAAEFAVQVTFLCTVKKPEDIVDAGLKDMENPLTQYLVRHQPLFHVGEDYEFDEITTVRRNVTAEVKAYVSVRPPRFRGMEVTLGNVQVLTPEELAAFERARRERRRESVLTSEGQHHAHSLAQELQEQQQVMEITKQRHNHDLKAQAELYRKQLAEMQLRLEEEQELQKRRHEQFVAEMREEFEHAREQRHLTHDQGLRSTKSEFEHTWEQRQLTHDQELRSAKFEHAIGEAEKLKTAIAAERSEVPSLLAASAGEDTIAETAELLNQDRQQARDAEAADSPRRETWAHEDAQAEWQAAREDARLRFDLKAEEIKAQLEVFRAGIARGLADAQTIDKLVGVIGGTVNELESVSASVPGTHDESLEQPEDSPDESKPSGAIEAVRVLESKYNDSPEAQLTGSSESRPPLHFLIADAPAKSYVNAEFSVLVRVTDSSPTQKHSSVVEMKPFHIADNGTEIIAIAQHSDGLRPLTRLEQFLMVPPQGPSEPVRFAFCVERSGLFRILVTAFNGGSCLGELAVEVSADDYDKFPEQMRTIWADLGSLRADPGEVTLQVRFDGSRYSFQLLSDSYLFEPVIAEALTADPGEGAERAIATLNAMTAGRSEYCGRNARTWMQETGIGLWTDMVPQLIKEQFWQLRPHINFFSIASGYDIIPWELLYPLSPSDDAGFLVEQFPVLRRAYGQGRCRRLSFEPALWIVPPASPGNAHQEVAAIRSRISASDGNEIDDLEFLIEQINNGEAGLLHFACHNAFRAEAGGSSIGMRGGSLVPTLLNRAVTTRALAHRRPLVFINACRTAGDTAQYTKLLGWAGQFMAAGAGAFLGTLWAVPSDSARVFAEAFYDGVTGGKMLGPAMQAARLATAEAVADPTWLAYTLYGDPQAVVSSRNPPAVVGVE